MAALVIDVTYGFAGDPGVDLIESTDRFPSSCGPAAWEAIGVLQRVLPFLREFSLPVFYTTGADDHRALDELTWGEKQSRSPADPLRANRIVEPLTPSPHDVVVAKTKPSAFFDTPLRQYLTLLGVRQVIVCGGTTSGCVRATVVDAFSHGYTVAVLQDGTFDRGEASHAISLFDMHQKYADVLTSGELLARMGRPPANTSSVGQQGRPTGNDPARNGGAL